MNKPMCDAADLLPADEVEDQRTLRGDEGCGQDRRNAREHQRELMSDRRAWQEGRNRGALVGRGRDVTPAAQPSRSQFSSARRWDTPGISTSRPFRRVGIGPSSAIQ